MKEIGNWFRQLAYRLRMALSRFMEGRYGTDKLNTAILIAGVVVCVAAMFVPSDPVKMVFTVVFEIVVKCRF